MRRLGSIINSMDINLSKFKNSRGQMSLACYCPWDHKELDVA